MNNILLIGNLKLFWFRQFINNVVIKIYNSHNIWLLSPQPDREMAKQYEDMGIHILIIHENSQNRLEFILDTLRDAYQIKKMVHFDIIHVQYVSIKQLLLATLIKQKDTKLIATFWGSDLVRNVPNALNKINYLLNHFTAILVTARRTKIAAQTSLSAKNAEKLQVIQFGLDSLKTIESLQENSFNRSNACQCIGLDPQKYIVAIGYNARPMQQHLKVISSLALLKDEVKKKVLIVLPMTYLREGNEDYTEEVKIACTNAGLDYVEFKDFLFEPVNSYLHIAVDIYINAQESDALSGSVVEFVYAGAILLNGSWLKYPEYDECGICYIEFNDFNELSGLVEMCISCKNKLNSDVTLKKIYTFFDWESCKKRHQILYEEMINCRVHDKGGNNDV